jgi:hypothetical protein
MIPTHELIGRILSGLLWALILTYSTGKGSLLVRRSFQSFLNSVEVMMAFHLFSHILIRLFTWQIARGTSDGRTNMYVRVLLRWLRYTIFM